MLYDPKLGVGTPAVVVERGSMLSEESESVVSVHDMYDVGSVITVGPDMVLVKEYQLSVLHGVLIMLSVLKGEVDAASDLFASADIENDAVERTFFRANREFSVTEKSFGVFCE